MTQPKRKPKPQENSLPPSITRHDFVDEQGIPKRVLLPQGETDPQTGIPVSLDLSGLYDHMPDGFLRDLYGALHAQGLVEPGDYFKPGAADHFRAAMLTVIRRDFLNAQALAKQELHNG